MSRVAGFGTPIRAANGVVTIAASSTANSNVSWDTLLANSSTGRPVEAVYARPSRAAAG